MKVEFMKKAIVLVVIMLLLGFGVRAQSEAGVYKLHVPTAEEFVAGIPDFKNLYETGYGYQARQMLKTIEAEFITRYMKNADYETLSAAFDKLKVRFMITPSGGEYPEIDYNFWVAKIVQVWLHEHNRYFSDLSVLRFDDYVISAERHDFDNDGQDREYLLNVIKLDEDGTIEYNNYLTASDGSREVWPVPVSWRGYGYDEGNTASRPLFDKGFEDITADGIPEWILEQNLTFSRAGFDWWTHITHILGWQKGHFIILLNLDKEYELKNLDDDPALEVSTHFTHADNWWCGYVEVTTYDWNGQTYSQMKPRFEPLDCTARHAEEAMWSGDFRTALKFYDQFIADHTAEYAAYDKCLSGPGDPYCEETRGIRIFDYFLFRRVVAYALLNDEAGVQDALKVLYQYFPSDEDTFKPTNGKPAAVCQAAYKQWEGQFGDGDSQSYSEGVFVPGTILEDVNSDDRSIPRLYETIFIDPIRAGCDIGRFNGTPTLIPTLIPTLSPTTTPDNRPQSEIYIDYQAVYSAFMSGDYDTALKITEQVTPENEIDTARWHYWHALALEALKRPLEALAEYTAIYERNPQSAWGKMAGLHLERSS